MYTDKPSANTFTVWLVLEHRFSCCGCLRRGFKTGFFIIRASVPRFIPLKSGMPSRGKWIGCAQSISLFSSVRICVEEFVMSVCVSACKAVGSGTRMPSFFFFSFFLFPLSYFCLDRTANSVLRS